MNQYTLDEALKRKYRDLQAHDTTSRGPPSSLSTFDDKTGGELEMKSILRLPKMSIGGGEKEASSKYLHRPGGPLEEAGNPLAAKKANESRIL